MVGCKFCTKEVNLMNETDADDHELDDILHEVKIKNKKLVINITKSIYETSYEDGYLADNFYKTEDNFETEIEFCPKCGQKL